MTWRINEMKGVAFPINTNVLRLDRDASFTLEVHRVEILSLHVARLNSACHLKDAVREGRLAMVNVGNDREIADF